MSLFNKNSNTGTGPGFCYTVTLYKSTGDQSPLHMFNCESNWQATFTTDAALASHTYTSTNGAVTTSTTSSTSSSTRPSATSTAAGAAATGPAAPSQKSNNGGLIAGATIGGIAAISLIGVAIWLAVRYTAANKGGNADAAGAVNGGAKPNGSMSTSTAYAEPYKAGMPYSQQQAGHYAPGYPVEVQGTIPGQHYTGQQELMGTPVGEMSAIMSPKP
jgi:hypothetical protein